MMWSNLNHLKSTINHSSSAEEISHAIEIVKPVLFIVDASVKRKLDTAIQLNRAPYDSAQIVTLISRLPGHSLVLDPKFNHSKMQED